MFKRLRKMFKKKDSPQETPKVSPPKAITPIDDPLIMIVDDYEDITALEKEYYVMCGLREENIHVAHSGERCLELYDESIVNDKKYNMIFMDVRMTGMNGYEATAELRKKGYDGIIVGLTGMVSDKNIDEGTNAGMDYIKSKPPNLPDILSLMRHHGIMVNTEPIM